MQPNATMEPRQFAASVRALLDEDVRRYRNFGIYWFFVKALLRRFYDRNAMPILGDYQDESVTARIPPRMMSSVAMMLEAAQAEYAENAAFNLGRNELADMDGEFFTLLDPDVEG